jgi:hypothetical protein
LVLLQGSSELAGFMAGIGYYRPDSRKQRTESPKQQSARTPIGRVSRFDTVSPTSAFFGIDLDLKRVGGRIQSLFSAYRFVFT